MSHLAFQYKPQQSRCLLCLLSLVCTPTFMFALRDIGQAHIMVWLETCAPVGSVDFQLLYLTAGAHRVQHSSAMLMECF